MVVSRRAPGCPLTRTRGAAHGEPRGQAARGSRARFAASGALTTVDFIRRSADESRVRTMRVIPEEKKGQLALKRSLCQRHDGQYPDRAVFQGSNEALDDCDAAALADSTAAMADIVLATPELEAGTSKLSAAVGHQMLGCGAATALAEASKEPLHLHRGGLRFEQCISQSPPRKVIDGHGQPPAKGPALRQRERKPRGPKAGGGRHGGQIDVPKVIGIVNAQVGRHMAFFRFVGRRGPGALTAQAADRARREMQPSSRRTWAILTFPRCGQSVCKRRTICPTISGNLLTGSGVRAATSGPSSLKRLPQEAMVAKVT